MSRRGDPEREEYTTACGFSSGVLPLSYEDMATCASFSEMASPSVGSCDYCGTMRLGYDNCAGGAVLTISGLGRAGDLVKILSTDLLVAAASVPAGMTSFSLKLYGASPGSALADNDAWDLPSGDRASYQGALALGTPVDVGSSLYIGVDGLSKIVQLGANGSLFAYLVATTGWTQVASTAFTVRLFGERV